MAFSLRQKIKQARLDHSDPIIRRPVVDDLAVIAEARNWRYELLYPAGYQICPGAKALGEDFMLWAEQGRHLLRIQRDHRFGPQFARRWAEYLHSYRRYPVNKVFRCAIPQATIISDAGAVISAEGEYLQEGWGLPESLRNSQIPANIPMLPGRFVSLIAMWGDKNIGHFFFDAMLRIAALDDVGQYRFLVPANLKSWHWGLFEAVGISAEQIVQPNASVTRVEELVLCHTSREGSMPRAELLLKFRDLARSNSGVERDGSGKRRVFVDRQGSKRKLINQAELNHVLQNRGFEFVRWEEMSVRDQIRLASETSVMVGPHGSSLLNSVYSPAGSKVLEIINPHWWDAATLRQNAIVGHEFWYCFGENRSKDYDTWVDPKKFARVLDYMLDLPESDPLPEW